MTTPTTFGKLLAGDRFIAFGHLYTKLDARAARKHSASIQAGADGYGCRLDETFTFEDYDAVQYVPPVALPAPAGSAFQTEVKADLGKPRA